MSLLAKEIGLFQVCEHKIENKALCVSLWIIQFCPVIVAKLLNITLCKFTVSWMR